jgi:hypothetical protein
VFVMIAPGTAKSLGPTSLKQSRFTLRLGAKLLDKFRHRQTRLELHSIHGHDAPPGHFCKQSTPVCQVFQKLAEDYC